MTPHTHLPVSADICREQAASCRSQAQEIRHSPNWDSQFPEVRRLCRLEYEERMAEAKRWNDKARAAK